MWATAAPREPRVARGPCIARGRVVVTKRHCQGLLRGTGRKKSLSIKAKPSEPPALMTPRALNLHHLAPCHPVVLQRLEEVKKLTEAIEYLPHGDPARDAMVKKDGIECIKSERAKAIHEEAFEQARGEPPLPDCLHQGEATSQLRSGSGPSRTWPGRKSSRRSSTVRARGRRRRSSFGCRSACG